MRPPRNGRFSTSVTFIPRRARSRAATSPATPPPITRAEGWMGMRRLSSGTRCEARAAAARTRREAFRVAASRSSTTQETCSRTLTCSKRYWLRPARSIVRRKVVWCRRRGAGGHHHAVELELPDLLFDERLAGVGADERVRRREHDPGHARGFRRDALHVHDVGDVPPQWHTKTPMRGGAGGSGVVWSGARMRHRRLPERSGRRRSGLPEVERRPPQGSPDDRARRKQRLSRNCGRFFPAVSRALAFLMRMDQDAGLGRAHGPLRSFSQGLRRAPRPLSEDHLPPRTRASGGPRQPKRSICRVLRISIER